VLNRRWLGRHDEAIVMLGVLEIILSNDKIPGRGGIASEMRVFFGDMMGSPTNFYIWPARLIVLGKLVLRLSVLVIVRIRV